MVCGVSDMFDDDMDGGSKIGCSLGLAPEGMHMMLSINKGVVPIWWTRFDRSSTSLRIVMGMCVYAGHLYITLGIMKQIWRRSRCSGEHALEQRDTCLSMRCTPFNTIPSFFCKSTGP